MKLGNVLLLSWVMDRIGEFRFEAHQVWKSSMVEDNSN